MRRTSTPVDPLVKAIVVMAGFGGIVFIALWLWSASKLSPALPSDPVLRARFHDHREHFERLAAMAIVDTQLVSLGQDPFHMRFYVYVGDTLTKHHLLSDEEVRSTGRSGYREQLALAGLDWLTCRPHGRSVWFVVGRRGGWENGYVYSEDSLKPLRPSIDAPRPPGIAANGQASIRPGRQSGYAAIAPKWFLFLRPDN